MTHVAVVVAVVVVDATVVTFVVVAAANVDCAPAFALKWRYC